jgi:hypothetical protein
MFRNVKTGETFNSFQLRKKFPNISFPGGVPPQDWLQKNGYEEFKPEAPKPTKSDLSSIRDRHLYGGITVSGMTIGTDNLTQQRIMAARIIAKEDDTYTVCWKLPSGFVELEADQIIAIADAIRAHVQSCFEAEATVLLDIADYETLEELEAAYVAALEG